tara:strand:- start:282 stop:719 length:438 start_codon:yes stop_codon:yes gene_type:complete
MGKVSKICISKKKRDVMMSLDFIEVVKGKGIINDRFFKENNHKKSQITLIEVENINYFNKISNSNIQAIDFRRNIITEGIKLNELLNKEFFIGKIKLKAHDLCRPCKYLQSSLGKDNLVEALYDKAGLRCEILSDGKIFLGDKIG